MRTYCRLPHQGIQLRKALPYKGQLISESINEVIVSPKIRSKNCQDFCPHYTGQKSWQFFVRILGETMTSYIHSENNWPLVHSQSQSRPVLLDVQQCMVAAENTSSMFWSRNNKLREAGLDWLTSPSNNLQVFCKFVYTFFAYPCINQGWQRRNICIIVELYALCVRRRHFSGLPHHFDVKTLKYSSHSSLVGYWA